VRGVQGAAQDGERWSRRAVRVSPAMSFPEWSCLPKKKRITMMSSLKAEVEGLRAGTQVRRTTLLRVQEGQGVQKPEVQMAT